MGQFNPQLVILSYREWKFWIRICDKWFVCYRICNKNEMNIQRFNKFNEHLPFQQVRRIPKIGIRWAPPWFRKWSFSYRTLELPGDRLRSSWPWFIPKLLKMDHMFLLFLVDRFLKFLDHKAVQPEKWRIFIAKTIIYIIIIVIITITIIINSPMNTHKQKPLIVIVQV